MFLSRFVLPVIALASVLCVLAACGGGTAGTFNDALDTPDNSFVGITDGEFKAVRFNEAGIRDAALNSTIGFTTRRTGDFTEVTISVNDTDNTLGVIMDLNYDSSRYHPVGSEFHGLVDSPIEAYIPNTVGLVGLGQVAFEEATRSGIFATVRFADGPGASVRSASIFHLGDVNDVYGTLVPDTMLDEANHAHGFAIAADGDDFTVTINSVYAQADGNDDGETNMADLTPLSSHGNYQVPVANDNFGPAAADYDGNGEPNLADISNLALNFSAITNHLEVWLSDNADMTDGAMHETLAFDDGVPSHRAGTPSYVTDTWDSVWRTWTGTITAADVTAADTNGDGEVFASALNADNDGPGDLFTPGVSVLAPVTVSAIEVDAVTVTLETVAAADGSSVEVTANATTNWDITAISGTFDNGSGAVPFDMGDTGAVLEAGDYDTALADVQGYAIWTVTNRTGDDFQATGDALVFADGGMGAPIAATVFPDWDTESTAAGTPEGSLAVTFDVAGGDLTSGIALTTIGIDVVVDATAPLVDPMMNSDLGVDGEGNWILNSVGETYVSGELVWGDAPASDSVVVVEFFNIGAGTGIMLDWTANPSPLPGEFTLDGTLLNARLAPAAPGSSYALRVSNGVLFSSVNDPGIWYATSAIEPKVAFETVPEVTNVGPGTDALYLLYPDPQIRRVPDITWNDFGGTFTPTDPIGSEDYLKGVNGQSQFPLAYDDSGNIRYPRLVIIELLAPGETYELIQWDTASTEGGVGIVTDSRSTNKVVLDIQTLTNFTPDMGTAKRYGYKLFGKYNEEVGYGEFSVQRMAMVASPPLGMQWGFNVFDGGADYMSADWTNNILDASTVGTNNPDVMFVEFSGGNLGDYPPGPGDENMFFTFSDGIDSMDVTADVRAAGLDTLGVGFIAVYEFKVEDFFDGIGSGVLKPGLAYEVQLDDPAVAGTPDFTFGPGGIMLIQNALP